MESVYHEGELAVQRRAGVEEMASRIGRSIRDTVPPAAAEFLEHQPMIVVATRDRSGRVWASLLTGPPGFVRAVDEQTVRILARPHPDDPAFDALDDGASVGLLAIEFETRRRMRLNGTIQRTGDGFEVRSRQVYSNCPKYIQTRTLDADPVPDPAEVRVQRHDSLTAEMRTWIEQADTFFIASAHAEAGADASHRGGMPGFVRVTPSGSILFPDYSGNTMFQTLGNLQANPQAGLLFLDFDTGATLQITGLARILWEGDEVARFPGAERGVEILPETIVEARPGRAPRWRFGEFSPHNPVVAAGDADAS